MIPPLASLVAFEAIARRQSFQLAASELHLTPSAVSHQMAKLEGLLGTKLLERSAKGVVTTAEEKIADVTSNTPVGTTQALIEQGAAVGRPCHLTLQVDADGTIHVGGRVIEIGRGTLTI